MQTTTIWSEGNQNNFPRKQAGATFFLSEINQMVEVRAYTETRLILALKNYLYEINYVGPVYDQVPLCTTYEYQFGYSYGRRGLLVSP
jgi:hypothetical protein